MTTADEARAPRNTRESTLLEGFGFTGYRSVRGSLQLIGPLGQVNLVAGQNNAGKSNILRFLQRYLNAGQKEFAPERLDAPRQSDSSEFEFAVATRLTAEDIAARVPMGPETNRSELARVLREIFAQEEFRLTGDDLVWFRYTAWDRQPHREDEPRYQFHSAWSEDLAERDPYRWENLSRQLTTFSGGRPYENVWRVLERFSPIEHLPPVRSIEAFRQIGPSDANAETDFYTGRGLIRGLQGLQSPRIDRQEDKQRFQAINDFVKAVLDDQSARLEVPHDAESILVHRGDLVLPLEHLGTGVHQVVILAVAATLLEDTLVCIEEPEVHLHPLLQRKLIRYLRQTRNQYVIATHSAHLLDHEHSNVFHVQLSDQGTEIQRAGTPVQVAALCADLGYRPSDLLQANAIIWVEGPSDRVYLRRWIQLLAPSLIEGIHFSIMFYGGRLLNHLTADDPSINEFISLRSLNRHIAILIDSDKKSERATIGDTKRRVQKEFDTPGHPGFAWVTRCRTIENYVPLPILKSAMAEVHPKFALTYTGDRWADPLAVKGPAAAKADPRVDKVRLAHVACDLWTEADLDHLDLRKRTEQVIQFIWAANGIEGE